MQVQSIVGLLDPEIRETLVHVIPYAGFPAAFDAFETVDKYAYRASPQDIADNDFNLNIPRYVDTFEPEPDVDIEATQREICELEQSLAEVRSEMAAYMEELGL